MVLLAASVSPTSLRAFWTVCFGVGTLYRCAMCSRYLDPVK